MTVLSWMVIVPLDPAKPSPIPAPPPLAFTVSEPPQTVSSIVSAVPTGTPNAGSWLLSGVLSSSLFPCSSRVTDAPARTAIRGSCVVPTRFWLNVITGPVLALLNAAAIVTH